MSSPLSRAALGRLVFALTIASTAVAARADSFIKCDVTFSSGGGATHYFKLSETSFSYFGYQAWVDPCEATTDPEPRPCSVSVSREYYRATFPVHGVDRHSATLSINRLTGEFFVNHYVTQSGKCEKSG